MDIRSNVASFNYTLAALGENPWFRDDLINNSSRIKKGLATVALGAGRHGMSQVYERLATRSYRKLGHTVLGLGFHSVVIADGDNSVQKVLHRSVSLSEENQLKYIDRLSEGQDVLVDTFGDVVVKQDYSIEPFELDTRKDVVVARQERIDGIPVDPLDTNELFNDFLQTAADLFESKGYMPDIVGSKNLFYTDDGLRLVDTTPLAVSNPLDNRAIAHALSITGAHSISPRINVTE